MLQKDTRRAQVLKPLEHEIIKRYGLSIHFHRQTVKTGLVQGTYSGLTFGSKTHCGSSEQACCIGAGLGTRGGRLKLLSSK
jgi:hypothetical protein